MTPILGGGQISEFFARGESHTQIFTRVKLKNERKYHLINN